VYESAYVVAGESVGTGSAKYGTFPLMFAGVAYGDGSGDGAAAGAPRSTLVPPEDSMVIFTDSAPANTMIPIEVGTIVAFGIGYASATDGGALGAGGPHVACAFGDAVNVVFPPPHAASSNNAAT
jgi:hypothetical protein